MIGAMWGLLATMAVPSEKGMLPVHGAKLAYEVAGQGPAIVLIYAGVADMSMWDEPFRELSKRFRVVRYDTRGFGRSLTEAVAFSNRADLLALMDHLKIDRAVIVGNSRGGQIALDFTLENPSRVSGVVFVAGGLSGFDPEKAGLQNIPTAKEKVVFDRIRRALREQGPGTGGRARSRHLGERTGTEAGPGGRRDSAAASPDDSKQQPNEHNRAKANSPARPRPPRGSRS